MPSPSISGVLGAGAQSMLGAMHTDRLKAFIWLSCAFPWMHCSTATTWRSRSRLSAGSRWSSLMRRRRLEMAGGRTGYVKNEAKSRRVRVRDVHLTSGQSASSFRLARPPSPPSTGHTGPRTTRCRGCFAGSPGGENEKL